MFEISVRTRFSAAHHLAGYAGSCEAVHGHNWDVEVFVRGSTLDRTGLLVDFRTLKAAVAEELADLDHADLNAVEGLAGHNPTSEYLAQFLYGRLTRKLNGDRFKVSRVAVQETPETMASYGDD